MNILQALNKTHSMIEKYVYIAEECNLSCVFCWQQHDKTHDAKIMTRIVQQIFNEDPKTDTLYNIMGGEIFADFIQDSTITSFKTNNQFHHKKTYNWLTNLIIDIDRFIVFLTELPLNNVWCTSYDPVGRFNQRQKQEWFNNLTYLLERNFKPHSISIVLTKQNIEYIMKGDPIFQKVYDLGLPLFFDFLSPFPHKSFNEMFPTESLVQEFFYFLIDNYPKCGPVSEWMDLVPLKASCRNSMIIGYDTDIITNCGNNSATKDSKRIELVDLSATSLQHSYIEERQCLSCEWLDVCPLGCFLNHQTNGFTDLPAGECMYRNALSYIKTNNKN